MQLRLLPAARLGVPRWGIGYASHRLQMYEQITGLIRTLLLTIESLGVATTHEVDIETLEQRLGDEVVTADTTIVWVSLIGAASRTMAEQ